ncbi:hypothetical protein EYF80_037845 [Liparis tanakae]|uniref:Uncharacterized protein n=1 Tax=Liparis tanakae TaxID=230148 RepID=A0A4Z2GEG5_9TELE|nr:hypothetical protein EYF80_037845 [Liparis tanakae]
MTLPMTGVGSSASQVQQTAQVTEVFDFAQQGQTLLQFPFEAAGVTLRHLRGRTEASDRRLPRDFFPQRTRRPGGSLTWQKSTVYLDWQSSEQKSSLEPPYCAVTSLLDMLWQ